MNYFRLVKTHTNSAEKDFNALFKDLHDNNFRILHTQYRVDEDGRMYGLFTYTDDLHHKR